MTRSGGYGWQQDTTRGAHRKPRKRSPLTRAVAAGGAVVCIGSAYQLTAPAVHALSIVFRSPDGQGNTNEVRVNILHGNIFDPQLGLLGANVSNNSTSASGTTSTPNNPLVDNFIFDNPITQLINAVLNYELVIGGAASGPINNTTQISFLSFNIFNPQASIFGGNLSNNTASANTAVGYGNNANASVTSVPSLWSSWFGGMTGNGNALQLAFLSGNIFNPQYSIFGPNVSNNTALTNIAENNGNYSQTDVTQAGGLLGAVARFWGGFLGGATGNGNTTQGAVGTSNITNPQVSLGGSNQSNNTAVTNEAVGNGNGSQTTVGGSGSVISTGTTGNGNTSQAAVGTSNIENTQVSIGDVGLSPRPEELSASQSNSQPTSTSTASTSTSPTGTSSAISSSSESGSGTASSAATTGTSSGTSGTTGTSGTSGTSGSGSTGDSGGSGGSGDSGGSGGG
jgi:hypothetical protein